MEKRTRKPGKSWTHCRAIQEQFVEKILSGEKTTTIRPDAKNMRKGDLLSFYLGWRKKGPTLKGVVILTKDPEAISLVDIPGAHPLIKGYLDRLARADGFGSYVEMIGFFKACYPLKGKANKGKRWRFEGKLISFELLCSSLTPE